MERVVFQWPIYQLLFNTKRFAEERSVIYCGARGAEPPLALFHRHRYKTRDIDISDEQIEAADRFAGEHGSS